MGSKLEEGAWIIDERGMGGTGVEGTFCHTVVLGTTCLVKGA